MKFTFLGVDPKLLSESESRIIQKDLETTSHSLVGIDENLIDLVRICDYGGNREGEGERERELTRFCEGYDCSS